MHMTATLTKWYDEHGRHEIFAGGKAVPLDSVAHSLKLNDEAVRAGAQTDLDDLGIAKNAREEKLQARKHKDDAGGARLQQDAGKNGKNGGDHVDGKYHEEMGKLYRQHVLKEQPTLQIQGLGGPKKKQEVQPVLHKPSV
jgi:hypothetical protein